MKGHWEKQKYLTVVFEKFQWNTVMTVSDNAVTVHDERTQTEGSAIEVFAIEVALFSGERSGMMEDKENK